MVAGSTMKRKTAVSLLTNRMHGASQAEGSFWPELIERIRDGQLIPVVSNGMRLEHIFQQLLASAQGEDGAEEEGGVALSVEDLISQAWAQEIGYPLADQHQLARVAQFNRVNSLDFGQAQKSYLKFLKGVLLAFAENLGAEADLIAELRERVGEASFADLVQELDYPQFEAGANDPLRVLARLPLPIFITTSYHDFLERALLAEGKKPHTEVCLWSGPVTNLAPEHEANRDFDPSPAAPLVYHLFGLERYHSTLVLSEDDYLDFLVKVTQDTDAAHPLIPLALRSALSVSSLVLLGYRLHDWDFRTLFRGVINSRPIESNRPLSMIIQLAPGEQYHIQNDKQARVYLETYFSPVLFKVQWSRSDQFLNYLWEEWNRRR
jgi:hypothetical protein